MYFLKDNIRLLIKRQAFWLNKKGHIQISNTKYENVQVCSSFSSKVFTVITRNTNLLARWIRQRQRFIPLDIGRQLLSLASVNLRCRGAADGARSVRQSISQVSAFTFLRLQLSIKFDRFSVRTFQCFSKSCHGFWRALANHWKQFFFYNSSLHWNSPKWNPFLS